MPRRLPWFKLHASSRNDENLDLLADDEFRAWFKLLCYASEQDIRGCIVDDDRAILAGRLRMQEEVVSRAVTRCHALGLLTEEPGFITFDKFAEYQYAKPSDRPEATRERQRRHRAKE